MLFGEVFGVAEGSDVVETAGAALLEVVDAVDEGHVLGVGEEMLARADANAVQGLIAHQGLGQVFKARLAFILEAALTCAFLHVEQLPLGQPLSVARLWALLMEGLPRVVLLKHLLLV